MTERQATGEVSRVMEQGRQGERVACLPEMTDRQNSDLARQISTERRANPGFLPDLQIKLTDGGMHVQSKPGTCEVESAAKQTADAIQNGPKDAKSVIAQINNITNEADRQRVLEEIKHRPNDFPNVKIVAEDGREPMPGSKLKAVPFDGKQVAETWKAVDEDLKQAGEKRVAEEAARLERMREHPEEFARELEELAKKGMGTAGDQKAESDYRKGMERLRELPADIQQKVIQAMVADPTVQTEVQGRQVVQRPNDSRNRSVVDMEKTYAQQAEEARQQFIKNADDALNSGTVTWSNAGELANQKLAQEQGNAGEVQGDKKFWFNYK